MRTPSSISSVVFLFLLACGGSSEPKLTESNKSPEIVVPTSLSVSENSTVVIDASSSSDPDGTIVSFHWTQISGPSVEISPNDTSAIEFTSPEVSNISNILIELTVTDNDGESSTARISISVLESGLQDISLSARTEESAVILEWNNANATSYRVLYWRDAGPPNQFFTEQHLLRLPNLNSGSYRFVVEGYDELGSSRFSNFISLEF